MFICSLTLSLIQRIHIYINVNYFNQTIFFHLFVSFKVIYSCIHRDFLKCLIMLNLGKSWNFKMVISRPGKVLKKCFAQMFWKNHENVLYSYVHLR